MTGSTIASHAFTTPLHRLLLGTPEPKTPRAIALWQCQRARDHRDMSRRGAYAWYVMDGQLKATQRAALLPLRAIEKERT